MTSSFFLSDRSQRSISIPAIGLDLFVRVPGDVSGGQFSLIETTNAPGAGPPRHRHQEAETFRVLEGRYLYEVDGERFTVEAGDVVHIPGGAAHGFVNVSDVPARQFILITPALDAATFFRELGHVMRNGVPDAEALGLFGAKWGVDFLGPPLRKDEFSDA